MRCAHYLYWGVIDTMEGHENTPPSNWDGGVKNIPPSDGGGGG